MKLRLLDWLQCPACGSSFRMETFSSTEEHVLEGALRCRCETPAPVIDGIPRFLSDWPDQFSGFAARYADRLGRLPAGRTGRVPTDFELWQQRTRRAFGYQWTVFGEMSCDFRDNFLQYLHPLQAGDLNGRLGLDVGCGFGRHLINAAACGAEMVGADLSRAVDSAAENAKHLPNVHLVQADLYRLPFRPQAFDLVYSLGVLHHLPDPYQGFRAIVLLAKPGGSIAVWLYSDSRKFINVALEATRSVSRRLPLPLLRCVSYAAATVDWGGFVLPYRAARKVPGLRAAAERIAWPRVKLYAAYPFQVSAADWFDRLGAPIRHYYNRQDVERWLTEAGLEHLHVSATGLYGWRGSGVRPAPNPPADASGVPAAEQAST